MSGSKIESSSSTNSEPGGGVRPPAQSLQMSDLQAQEELDEHNGLRFLMQGAMLGIRNTRSHPDEWEPDEDDNAVLELLGFASWLHKSLDRCEEYQARP